MKVRAEGRVFVKKLELKKLVEFHTKTANMSIKVGPTHKKSPCPTSGVSPKVVLVNLEMLEGSAQTAASERRAPASGSREAADQQQQQEHLEPQQRPAEGSPGASAHLHGEQLWVRTSPRPPGSSRLLRHVLTFCSDILLPACRGAACPPGSSPPGWSCSQKMEPLM